MCYMYFENFRKPESDFKSSFNHHQLRTLSELFCTEEQFPNANHTLHSEVLNLQQRLFPISFKHFHPAQLLVAKTAVTLMSVYNDNLSRVVRKPAFCICENKDADQLRGNREADQRLCLRYTDSTFPLLPKSEISSL